MLKLNFFPVRAKKQVFKLRGDEKSRVTERCPVGFKAGLISREESCFTSIPPCGGPR